jgi:ABC-type multidrug transport system fused ATPase/permease subunit
MATLSEALAAVRTVVVFAQEPREHRKYDELLMKAYELSKRAAVFQGTAEGAARMSINLGTLALLSYGGHLVLAGELTIGTLLAFNVYNLFIGSGLGSISSSLAELTKASGAVKRVFDLMPVEEEEEEEEEEDPAGGVARNRRTEGRAEGRVSLDEVTFTYPGKTEPALRSVSGKNEPYLRAGLYRSVSGELLFLWLLSEKETFAWHDAEAYIFTHPRFTGLFR